MSDPVPPSGLTPDSTGSSPTSASAAGVFPGTLTAPADEGYSSLSITALIGFGIGSVYAVVVCWLALVGLFTGRPVFLDSWTFVFPVAAILLCLISRSWISSSEGTLAGEGLTRWGLLLSLFVALGYGAYITAISFAVRQQARSFADAWMENLRQQERTKAAMATLPPLARLDLREEDPDLQRKLAQKFQMNAGEQMADDPLVKFGQHQLVRLLLQGGKESRINSKGVRSWEFTKGGYLVSLHYEIEVPEGTYSAIVTLHGSKAPHNEYPQRQWAIDFEKTNLERQEKPPELSAFGVKAKKLQQDGRQYAFQWLMYLSLDRPAAFLSTIPASDRDKAAKQLTNIVRMSAITGPIVTNSMEGGSLLRNYQQFLAGEMTQIDADALQGTSDVRLRLTELIRFLIPGPQGLRGPLELARETEPLYKVEGNRVRLSFDFQVAMREQFTINGILELEGDAKALEAEKMVPNWHVARIRIVSGRMMKTDAGKATPRPGQP